MRFRLLASLLLAAMLGLLSGCTLLATATTGPLIDQHLPANYSGVAAVRKDARTGRVAQKTHRQLCGGECGDAGSTSVRARDGGQGRL